MSIKGFEIMMKIHKRQADRMRREMAIIEEGKQQLVEFERDMEAQLKEEQELCSGDLDAYFAFGGYMKRVIDTRKRITESMKDFDMKIRLLANKIGDEFAEMKKFEIMKDMKERAIEEERKKQDRLELDEIASQNHTRKNRAS